MNISFDLPHFTMLQRTKEPMTFHTTYPFISGQKRRIYQQKILAQKKKEETPKVAREEQLQKIKEKFLQQVDLTEEKKDLEAINKKIEIEQKNIETLKQHIQSIKELSTKLNQLQSKSPMAINKTIPTVPKT